MPDSDGYKTLWPLLEESLADSCDVCAYICLENVALLCVEVAGDAGPLILYKVAPKDSQDALLDC